MGRSPCTRPAWRSAVASAASRTDRSSPRRLSEIGIRYRRPREKECDCRRRSISNTGYAGHCPPISARDPLPPGEQPLLEGAHRRLLARIRRGPSRRGGACRGSRGGGARRRSTSGRRRSGRRGPRPPARPPARPRRRCRRDGPAGRADRRTKAASRGSRSARRRAIGIALVGRERLGREQRERQHVGRAVVPEMGLVQAGQLGVVGQDQADRGRARALRRPRAPRRSPGRAARRHRTRPPWASTTESRIVTSIRHGVMVDRGHAPVPVPVPRRDSSSTTLFCG